MVLSNGDPVTFARMKSKEEADNLTAWINHLLGVQVEKEEEVKVKEEEEVKVKDEYWEEDSENRVNETEKRKSSTEKVKKILFLD